MQDSQDYPQYDTLNDFDPQQLKKVIKTLLRKTNTLITSLESMSSKMEELKTQEAFWKHKYFQLKKSCQRYIEEDAFKPYQHVQTLEDELKKQKLQKLFITQKYEAARKSKRIIKIGLPEQVQTFDSLKPIRKEQFVEQSQSKQMTVKKIENVQKSISTVMFSRAESPQERKTKSKQTVGPKKINVFRFSQKID